METDHDPPSQENQEQETSDDQQRAAASPIRSYDCTFCKRGFSNAQALGGHMNIHRKDKAKLKQAASSNNLYQQSFDISKIRASNSQISTIKPSMEVMSNSQDRNTATQRPNWILGAENDAMKSEKTQVGDVRKLSLFVEGSSPLKIDQREATSTEKGLLSSSSEEEDLDLELRLGPEPRQDSSTPATGTKKFF